MVVKIPYRLITHNQKIGNLYKKWLRHLEGECRKREEFRFKAAVVRADFDLIMSEKDLRKSKQMLAEKEREFLTAFVFDPIYFPQSPKGTDYERHTLVEDWVLDFWHPYEKAAYPHYFARRELRKQQFLEMWEKQHQPPPPCDH